MQLIRFSLATSALVALAIFSAIEVVEALPANTDALLAGKDISVLSRSLGAANGKFEVSPGPCTGCSCPWCPAGCCGPGKREIGGVEHGQVIKRQPESSSKDIAGLREVILGWTGPCSNCSCDGGCPAICCVFKKREIDGDQASQVSKRQPVMDPSSTGIVLRDITVNVNSRLLGPCSNCACGINCPSTCCGLEEVRTEPARQLTTSRGQSDMPHGKREIDGSQGSLLTGIHPETDSSSKNIVLRHAEAVMIKVRYDDPCALCSCDGGCPPYCCALEVRTIDGGQDGQVVKRQIKTDTSSKGLVMLRDLNPCHSCDCQDGCPAGCCGLDKRKIDGGQVVKRQLGIDASSEGALMLRETADSMIIRDKTRCKNCSCAKKNCPSGCCEPEKREIGAGEEGRAMERKLEIGGSAEGIEIRADGVDDR